MFSSTIMNYHLYFDGLLEFQVIKNFFLPALEVFIMSGSKMYADIYLSFYVYIERLIYPECFKNKFKVFPI